MNAAFYETLKFAIKAHDGQYDKGGLPYVLHPLHVANNVAFDYPISYTHLVTVALLHDVLEDTEVTYKELSDTFGEKIAEDVFALTRGYSESDGKLFEPKDYPNKTGRWGRTLTKETYKNYIKRVQKNPLATLVKIEDLRHNLSRMENIPPIEREGLKNRYLKALVYLMDPSKYPEY